jgi:hypothetical protein
MKIYVLFILLVVTPLVSLAESCNKKDNPSLDSYLSSVILRSERSAQLCNDYAYVLDSIAPGNRERHKEDFKTLLARNTAILKLVKTNLKKHKKLFKLLKKQNPDVAVNYTESDSLLKTSKRRVTDSIKYLKKAFSGKHNFGRHLNESASSLRLAGSNLTQYNQLMLTLQEVLLPKKD